ncbi:MAG TPA: histidine kinase [Saprospiraceae bacterium]|nr:histidine kinase [Saprospiraceae bacterium]HNG88951.1 histidine kinase [Saprospiraceae bacterium]
MGRTPYRQLFLLSFWGIWLALPFFMLDDDDQRHREFLATILPASLTNVVLFFLVAEWPLPRLLRQQRMRAYLLSAVGLSLAFIVLQGFMKTALLAPDHKGFPFHLFRSLFHVFFATALGVGYALVLHTRSQEKTRQEERQERLQAELSFLRSQISPHFIFNILNTIVYLIRSRSDRAEPVTLQLSELMRYLLYEQPHTQIPLERELGYLHNYVALQKIRFEEDVDIRLAIEGRPGSQLVEPMLLIPFVENAFKHGVGLVDAPLIDIHVHIGPQRLIFSVKNKITPETAVEKDASSGIGLQNVRRRLELLYPDAHRLEVSESGGWYAVRLEITLG